MVKNLPTKAGEAGEVGAIPGWGRSPEVRKWQPTPVFWPRGFHRQRSLAGYSPWGHKEMDTTEQLSTFPTAIHGAKLVYPISQIYLFQDAYQALRPGSSRGVLSIHLNPSQTWKSHRNVTSKPVPWFLCM